MYKDTSENKIYTSEELDKLWGKGYTTLGAVTFASAAYVARYIMKKINGDERKKHYEIVDKETGEVLEQQRKQEYTTMSRRPGIGKEWYEKYNLEIYPEDEVVINGKKVRPPKYYDNLLEVSNKEMYQKVIMEREDDAFENEWDNTEDRLLVRETVAKSKLNLTKRKL